jgi:DNA-binding NarL/FixJ family response regulator
MPKEAPERSASVRTTSVVVVDDHVGLRQMLRVVLERQGGFNIVGEAGTAQEAMKVCRALKPAVVILDLALPGLGGIHVLRLLLRETWGVRVLVYTGTMDKRQIAEAMAEHPHGFASKEDSLPSLRVALHAVARGARHVTAAATRLLPGKEGDLLQVLTHTERTIFDILGDRLQAKEIADLMDIAMRTLEHHREHIREKLGLVDAAALTRFAMNHRLHAA